MGPFNKLQKEQIEHMCGGRKVEHWCVPCDKSHSPHARKPQNTLWVVQEAIDSGIGEVPGKRIEHEVAEEPAKLSERVVDAGRDPQLQCNQRTANNIP